MKVREEHRGTKQSVETKGKERKRRNKRRENYT